MPARHAPGPHVCAAGDDPMRSPQAALCPTHSGSHTLSGPCAQNRMRQALCESTECARALDPFLDRTNVSLTFGAGGNITSGLIEEHNSAWELIPLTITGDIFTAIHRSDSGFGFNCGI